MPRFRIFLWVADIVLPCAAMMAIRKDRPHVALSLLTPGYLVITAPLLAFSTIVVRAASTGAFMVVAGLDVLLALLMFWWARRKGKGLLIALPILVVFVHLVAAGGILHRIWQVPESGACAQLAEQPGVFQASRGHGTSPAHQSLYLPGTDLVAASFKKNNDSPLSGLWSEGQNTVAVFSALELSGRAAPVAPPIAMDGSEMPQFILYDSRGRLVVTVNDRKGLHGVGIIDNPSASKTTFDHWISLPYQFEPNGIMEDEGKYIVFAFHIEVLSIDMETLEIEDHWFRPDQGWFEGGVILYMRPGVDGVTYLSTLGFHVIEHNIRTRENRKLHIPWGGAGGVLHVLEGKNQIVVTDMIFHHLIFIDRDRWEIERVFDLPFGPRGIVWDKEREILFVGDYIEGEVHGYRFSDLKELGEPVRVGGNLRNLTFDPRERRLLAGSKCGLVGVDVDEAFGMTSP